MINFLLRHILGRQLVLYNQHRNSLPLVNEGNKKKFLFVSYMPFWKATRVFGRNTRLRFRAMAMVLSFLKPAYIIDINWIAKYNRLFYLWCRKHRPSRFIVVQHGLYIGGIITDKAHKYAKCDIMLCWGKQTIAELARYNERRDVQLVKWGNPLYNLYDRNQLQFKKSAIHKVLIAPTLLTGERKEIYEELVDRLQALRFEVVIKGHNYQAKRSQPIKGAEKISDDLYKLLLGQDYDLVVSDISTCLVDALYFKNRVLFFSPEGDLSEYLDNAYSRRLINQVYHFRQWQSREDVERCIDLEAQEILLDDIVCEGDNNLARLEGVCAE